jgi:NAD dependent epimerase/dehydratase family
LALRFFNVFGLRQALSNPYTGVLAIFASRCLNDQPPLIYEDGRQRRDFVHVYDIARACRLALEGADLEEITDRLILAKTFIPFVQGNLMDIKIDDPAKVAAWRGHLQNHGVWANQPVPVFYYPGSPGYREIWGEPDDLAWERAHEDYLRTCAELSDLQDQQPLALSHLEAV